MSTGLAKNMTQVSLPPPGSLLGLDAFQDWYPGQDKVFARLLEWLNTDSQRFMCASLPTGSGKSLISALCAALFRKRTVVLTATKGLQDQFVKDFYSAGVRDIRGQNSYPCILLPEAKVTVDEGPCHAGMLCPYRNRADPETGLACTYYAELAKATRSSFVVTNYSFWLAQANTERGLGSAGLLVMDEADQAFGSIESYLTTHLSAAECKDAGLVLPRGAGAPGDWAEWKSWAHEHLPAANRAEQTMKTNMQAPEGVPELKEVKQFRQLQKTIQRLEILRGGLGEWVCESTGGGRRGGGHGVLFTPVWPGKYANLLYQQSSKVLLMSATLTPKTADLLGIPEEDRDWLDVGSTYAAARTPIQHVRTIRVDHKASDADMRMWVSRIDQILDQRTDRKGIILPVSYTRCRFLVQHSRHADRMISHESGGVQEAVAKWRATSPPATLVSPAIARGWDFPDDECRYILIGKIPFPDGRTPAAKARNAEDPDFAGFEAMQTIVQEAGRGTRSPDDWCEVFILDDHWGWFWSKNNQHAPEYFRKRLKRRADVIPAPLEVR